MAKGITSGGVDFDDLFDPDVMGNGPSASWITSGGVALKYAALSYGTKRANVGWANSAGVDVSNLWAAKGTAVYFPGYIFAQSLSNVGGLQVATVRIQIKTNGQIHVQTNGTTNGGGGITNYVPTAAGASAAFDFRISGTIVGIKNASNTAQLTGKGGINFNAGVPPAGSSSAFDTGWQASADDVGDFLFFNTRAPNNVGAGQLTCSGGGRMRIQIRRKSDSVVVFDTLTEVYCVADSQL